MDLHRLELFVAVAEELHFNRAADRLHMAQPPLSRQIRKLEDECGVDLFVRTTRRVELTPAGEVLLPEARKLLAGRAGLRNALAQARDGRAGHLRLGFVSSAALDDLPRLVRRMRAEAPGVEFELTEMTTDRQLEHIRQGRLDAGIVREAPTGTDLRISHLRDERLYVALPDGHPLGRQSRLTLADLRGQRFVGFPRRRVSRLYDHTAALLHQAGADFDVVQEAVQFPTILGLVSAEIGIAIVPACMRAMTIPGVAYLPLADPQAVSRLSLLSGTQDGPLLARLRRAAGATRAADSGG